MALVFDGSSNYVNHGSAAVLDNLGDQTIIIWFHSIGTLEIDSFLTTKEAGATDPVNVNFENTGYLEIYYARNNNNWNNRLHARSAAGLIQTSQWQYVAAAIDPAGVAADQELYWGDLNTPVAEVGAYGTQLVGSGSHDDSGASQLAANNGVANGDTGLIALVGIWNIKLTLAQIQQQQYSLFPVVAPANCVLFTNYGWNGTGTQPDWSGNGNNGTVTGSTVAAHVPLGLPVSPIFYDQPAVAVAGKTPYVFIM